jgi:hypothetical protein
MVKSCLPEVVLRAGIGLIILQTKDGGVILCFLLFIALLTATPKQCPVSQAFQTAILWPQNCPHCQTSAYQHSMLQQPLYSVEMVVGISIKGF